MIQCPNPTCRAPNSADQSACHACQSLLIRRYLWATGEGLTRLGPNALVADRFQRIQGNLLLDTRPGEPWRSLDSLPAAVVPYLRLTHLASQIPRPFAYLPQASQGLSAPLLLLERSPIQENESGVSLLPTLDSQWRRASPLRQVNWLRQMAWLWSPLLGEAVASTLLRPDLLRVDGSLLRLLALEPPQTPAQPSLAQLGQAWKPLVKTAHASVRPFLEVLVQHLADGKLSAAGPLMGQLERATRQLATAQPIIVDLATATDQGPTRQRNEDACYPPSGSDITVEIPPSAQARPDYPLVIVCDGIGGHEGGDVASQLAIANIQEHLKPILQQDSLSSQVVLLYLQRAIRAANNAISARNDQEKRQARGRMGTTLVMALVHPPFLYLAHLGDSRAYRISRHGCDQITLDDDVASRESRLGYALYRDALQVPNAGSLIQALGISNGDYLVPNIQHHLLDDDSLYLLCSDGLSDFDRIEGTWRSVVRPVLTRQTTTVAATQQLVAVANTYNGHDNVTVALLQPRSQPPRPFPALAPSLFPLTPGEDIPADLEAPPTAPVPQPSGPTQLASAPAPAPAPAPATVAPRRRFPWRGLGLLALAIALASGGIRWWWLASQPPPAPFTPLGLTPTQANPLVPLRLPLAPPPAVAIGSYWQITGATAAIALRPQPETAGGTAATAPPATALPAGSILKVMRRQVAADQREWVQLDICSTPAGTSLIPPPQESDTASPGAAPSDRLGQLSLPGETGWLDLNRLTGAATALATPTSTQQGVCR